MLNKIAACNIKFMIYHTITARVWDIGGNSDKNVRLWIRET